MQKLRIGLAVLVTIVWLIGYTISYVNGADQPTEVTGLMAIVLGWAFAGHIRDQIKERAEREAEKIDREQGNGTTPKD